MKKKGINIATAIIAVMVFSFAAQAQRGQLKLGLNYNYSTPLSGFKNDLISNSSPRGATGEVMYSFNNKWAVGVLSGYQDYYQKYARQVYNLDKNQQVSAVLSNSISTIPILAKVRLTPATGFVQPYVSLGAGVDLINYDQYLGQFGNSTSSASFMAQGDAGVMIPFGRLSASGVQIGAGYNYVPYKKNGYTDLNSFDVHVGVHFPI